MYKRKFLEGKSGMALAADQNDSFSDSSYLFPIQRILQNQAMIATTEANSILDLG